MPLRQPSLTLFTSLTCAFSATNSQNITPLTSSPPAPPRRRLRARWPRGGEPRLEQAQPQVAPAPRLAERARRLAHGPGQGGGRLLAVQRGRNAQRRPLPLEKGHLGAADPGRLAGHADPLDAGPHLRVMPDDPAAGGGAPVNRAAG